MLFLSFRTLNEGYFISIFCNMLLPAGSTTSFIPHLHPSLCLGCKFKQLLSASFFLFNILILHLIFSKHRDDENATDCETQDCKLNLCRSESVFLREIGAGFELVCFNPNQNPLWQHWRDSKRLHALQVEVLVNTGTLFLVHFKEKQGYGFFHSPSAGRAEF